MLQMTLIWLLRPSGVEEERRSGDGLEWGRSQSRWVLPCLPPSTHSPFFCLPTLFIDHTSSVSFFLSPLLQILKLPSFQAVQVLVTVTTFPEFQKDIYSELPSPVHVSTHCKSGQDQEKHLSHLQITYCMWTQDFFGETLTMSEIVSSHEGTRLRPVKLRRLSLQTHQHDSILVQDCMYLNYTDQCVCVCVFSYTLTPIHPPSTHLCCCL